MSTNTLPFSSSALQKVVTDTLQSADIPDGHKNAVVLATDTNGVKFMVTASRRSADWQWKVQAAAEHRWHGDTLAGASVLLSWK